ncbi:unnamed protein product [Meloidogyne enterolobii]|uniref:Uncharacterized protein n=1 Tax=Meloidogyne enterolobii TaxID=390850 RepID=A0ACB0ZHX4_MELEN
MALNMNNKKLLTSQILPEVEISINPNGITISSARLLPPRFIPYDQGGKCRECKSTEVELDFVVTKEGITIYCTRISGTRFVPFDIVYDLPGICFFKIKNKGRVFNIPHNSIQPSQTKPQQPCKNQIKSETQETPLQNSAPPRKRSKTTNENAEQKEKNILDEFFDSLDAATTGIQSDKINNLKKQAINMKEEEDTAIESLFK